jgi:hypothetical protein
MDYAIDINGQGQSLFRELGAWNVQETRFAEIFSREALADREFRKMKLSEYDRLYHRYSTLATTSDEKALLTMLKFQRRKLERSLFPSLLGRLMHRAIASFGPVINARREMDMASRSDDTWFAGQNIALKSTGDPFPTEKAVHGDRKQKYGNDWGRRKQNRYSKGRSL